MNGNVTCTEERTAAVVGWRAGVEVETGEPVVAGSAGVVGPQGSALKDDLDAPRQTLSSSQPGEDEANNMDPRETRRQLVGNLKEATARRDNNNEMSQTSAAEGFGRVGGPGERPGSIAASSVYSDDLARGEGQSWGPTGDDADPFTASYTNEEGERFPSEIQPLRVGLADQPPSGLKRFSALQNYSYPATSARHQSILRDYSAWAAERGPGHDDEGWSNWDYEEARANDLRIYGEEDSGEGPSGEQSDSYESIYACSSPDPGKVSPSGEPQALPQPTRAHQHHQESADSSRLLPPRADLQGRDDSPLDQYMPVEAQAGPSAPRRTGTKNLFGDGGWLADTSSSAQQTPAQKKLEKIAGPRRSPNKPKSRFLGGFMKKARGIVESPSRTFGPPLRRSPASMPQPPRSGEEPPTPPPHIPRQSQLVISLSPREQSLIYCELDFAIADALNDYIMSQFNLGRVDHATIKKTADEWAKKGLPKVKGFRYDVDTQLSILRAHIEQFKFYGQAATTVPSMLGIIDTMRTTAREMRLRTYCVPDVVISKWLWDITSFFAFISVERHRIDLLQTAKAFFESCRAREIAPSQDSLTRIDE